MVTIKANEKKQTMQKVIVEKYSATLQSVTLFANGRYKTIREVAATIGVKRRHP
jgi:phosphoribosyl-dephospho-CoA transferase